MFSHEALCLCVYFCIKLYCKHGCMIWSQNMDLEFPQKSF